MKSCEIHTSLYPKSWSDPSVLWMLRPAHPLIAGRVTVPAAFTVPYPDPAAVGKLSWLLWDLLLTLFRAICLFKREKRRQTVLQGNLSLWPFQQHLHKAAGGQEEQREGEHSSKPSGKQTRVGMGGAAPQACSTGAAAVLASFLGRWLPKQAGQTKGDLSDCAFSPKI